VTDAGRQEVLRVNQLAREGRVDVQHAPFAEHRMRLPYRDYMAFRRVFATVDPKGDDEAFWTWMETQPAADAYRVRSRKAQLGHF
jgi:hypothetical protein